MEYQAAVKTAEEAVASMKDAKLREIAFAQILANLLAAEKQVASHSPTRQKPIAPNKAGSGEDDDANPIEICNAIKEHESFSIYESHVLHKKNMYHKIALVCLHFDKPLSSGSITKVLDGLNVKVDLGNISNNLKMNSGKFIGTVARKKGGAKPRYKLTSHAKAEFNAWLNQHKK